VLGQTDDSSESPAARGPSERRSDELLRSVVQYCGAELAQHGFALDGRGRSEGRGWVRFGRPGRDAEGHQGTLVLLVAHGRAERTLLFDAYFIDDALDVHTPHAKLVQWYEDDAELPSLIRQAVDHVCNWVR
jgi:hypothetical protein